MRYIIPLMVSPGKRRHVVKHKKFSQKLSMELDKVKEGTVPSLEKQSFGGKLLRIWSQ